MEDQKEDGMKLKTKIRAGRIRPNHNVTVHRTAASGSGTPTVVKMPPPAKATTTGTHETGTRTHEMEKIL
jgi:hypothetical protein